MPCYTLWVLVFNPFVGIAIPFCVALSLGTCLKYGNVAICKEGVDFILINYLLAIGKEHGLVSLVVDESALCKAGVFQTFVMSTDETG